MGASAGDACRLVTLRQAHCVIMMVRQLDANDAAAYQDLRLRALHESPTAFSSSLAEEQGLPASEVLKRVVPAEDGSKCVFGAFAADELAGIVAYIRQQPVKIRHCALLAGMYVAQDFRRRGFGRALLAAAIAYAHSVDGVLQLKISVNSQNAAARLLYQSVGFKRFGVEPNALLVDGQFYDEEHYVLPVDVRTEPLLPQN
jgi:RimJ/RimL family protein N-acetyltransferase